MVHDTQHEQFAEHEVYEAAQRHAAAAAAAADAAAAVAAEAAAAAAAQAAASPKPVAKKTEYEDVLMEDGRTVKFPWIRKLIKIGIP
jgi:hypothetical protein